MTATGSLLEHVVLVDAQDREIGTAEKLSAHKNNMLHRAFSIFIFRNNNELLLQQRALDKYHTQGLWTNTCCSHPRPGETITQAGERRLQEELGISCSLKTLGWFHYNAHFPNGLSENEIDHVLIGNVKSETKIFPNPNEIHAHRWISLHDLKLEMDTHPEKFTPWFKKALEIASTELASHRVD